MSRVVEFCLLPGEYLVRGDRPIKAPPLINTSLLELAQLDWYLSVYATYIPSYDSTKLKYRFFDSNNDTGFPYLVFKKWVKGDKRKYDDIVDILLQCDLTPNFTKAPSFMLMPDMKEPMKETELGFLMRINKERAKKLPKKKVDKAVLEKRVAKIIEFPVRFGTEDDGDGSLYSRKERLVS